MRKSLWIIPLLLLFAAIGATNVHADTIQYSSSGTFSASTPSSAFSGPGDTWAFSFQIDSNPTVSNPTAFFFEPVFSNFSYLLNGSPVVITPDRIPFFTTAASGDMVVCFTVARPCTDGFETNISAPQMFTGPTSAPTMSAGAFTSTWDVYVGNTQYLQAGTATIEAVVTPEPSSTLLLGTGLLFIFIVSRKKLFA